MPARGATFLYLALAVLGALGAGRLFDGLPRRVAALALGGLAAALVVEGYGGVRVGSVRPEPDPAARAAALWLRQAPPRGVLELPLGVWHEGRPLVRELRYQYATLLHGKPIVNGFSGYDTPLRRFLLDSPMLAPPELARSVEALSAIGVRYLVLHLDEYEDGGVALFGALHDQRTRALYALTLSLASERSMPGGPAGSERSGGRNFEDADVK